MGKDKYLYGLIPLIFGIILVSAYFISNNNQLPPTEQGLNYESMVCVYKNGQEVGCHPNTLFTNGANLTRDCLMTGTCSAITNITLCNASAGCTHSLTSGAASGQTFNYFTACGVGPDGAAGTASVNTGSNGNWTITKTFTSTCDNIVTNVTRIGDATVSFAGNNFTIVTLQTNDQLVVNWTMVVN